MADYVSRRDVFVRMAVDEVLGVSDKMFGRLENASGVPPEYLADGVPYRHLPCSPAVQEPPELLRGRVADGLVVRLYAREGRRHAEAEYFVVVHAKHRDLIWDDKIRRLADA